MASAPLTIPHRPTAQPARADDDLQIGQVCEIFHDFFLLNFIITTAMAVLKTPKPGKIRCSLDFFLPSRKMLL